MFNDSNSYKLNTRFYFDEPVEDIWEKIIDFENWPSWWTGIERVDNLHKTESIKGNTYKSVVRGFIPYSLIFYSFVDKIIPMSLISAKINGDLEGSGVCRFSEKRNGTELYLEWNVSPTKLWMKILSPVARSYFVKNHDKILNKGFAGLIKNLEKNNVQMEQNEVNKI